MATHPQSMVEPAPSPSSWARERWRPRTLRYLVPFGRVFFAAIFVILSFAHFSSSTIEYAAARGVPLPGLLVPISGAFALAGGISVLIGYKTRLGAAMLVVFLVPVTLLMHPFWSIDDAQVAMVQRAMFLKNLSMLGGALLLLYFGAGPISFDARKRNATPRTAAPPSEPAEAPW